MEKFLRNFKPEFPEGAFRYALIGIVLLAILLPLSIYAGILRIPTIALLNGMAVQPKYKAQSVNPYLPEGVTMQPAVDGTVPRGHLKYQYVGDVEAAAANLVNPVPPTLDNLQRGEVLYDTYCQPCHGYKGKADGSAVGPGRMPAPLPLTTEQSMAYPDGRIYHVITEGQNTMPGYAKQIEPRDRWLIVNYVRVLQRAANPQPEDLPATGTVQMDAGTTPSMPSGGEDETTTPAASDEATSPPEEENA